MSLSDKIKRAKQSDSLFADIPPEKKFALKKASDVMTIDCAKSLSSVITQLMDSNETLSS